MNDAEIVSAEIAAIHAACNELASRDPRLITGSALPPHAVTVTHPREVFADTDTCKAAERIGKLGRIAGVSLVIDPHNGQPPASLADFGGSVPLRAMFLASGNGLTVGAGR